MAAKYPKLDNGHKSARPFRLWNAEQKHQVRWRCYLHPYNAHNGALIEARYLKPGEAIEMFDIRTGALWGQYVRTPTAIELIHIRRGSDVKESE